MSKKILFVVPYPLHESPSQRFRFEQYFELLQAHGYRYFTQSFLDLGSWRAFFKSGNTLLKIKALSLGLVKRIIILFTSPMYDFVFIHREAAPLGPPVFEWLLAKIFRRKIIYDFDDAIWLTDRAHESWLLRTVKWRQKVASICKWSYKVSCGNEYLCNYARQFNKNVVYNPTTIDTENLHNPALYKGLNRQDGHVRIGWTGSHSTLKYLHEIEDVLMKILLDYPQVEFVVIADKPPSIKAMPSVKFVTWNTKTEIEDLLLFDIGIMPLPDDKWAQGKCGFKALQYMALKFPAVASPVGVNTRIINHNENGYLCSTPGDWEAALRMLIGNEALRKQIGSNGRKTILEGYSVISNASNFLSLFE